MLRAFPIRGRDGGRAGRRRLIRFFALGVLAASFGLILSESPIARADDQTGTAEESAAESRATEFRAVTGPQKEDVPGGPLLVSAYAVAWLVIGGLVFRMAKMHGHTARELERLRQVLDKSEPRK